MSKEEIALQLTLKAIERMATSHSTDAEESNTAFSDQVVSFYNNIYNKLDNTIYG